ncbi:hypothetical protein BT96DRAFT_918290, partial [Gymnopus androsaceus JB14]
MTTNIPTNNSAASLVSNANTVSSTVPLNPRQVPQKDYAAAFVNLQSRYGAVPAHLPTPTPAVRQKKAKDSPQASAGQSTSSGISDATEEASGSKADALQHLLGPLHLPQKNPRRKQREPRKNASCFHGKQIN